METLNELFEDSIKDIYNAEKQFLKAMPKVMKKTVNEELKASIQTHIDQTEKQIERLEQVAQAGGFKPTGKVCHAAQGLVEECQEHLSEGKPGAVLDAAIIGCLQKNEHYEIATYGTILTWAKELGQTEAVTLLKETLNEEELTDKLLTGIAKKGINAAAKAVAKEPATAGKK